MALDSTDSSKTFLISKIIYHLPEQIIQNVLYLGAMDAKSDRKDTLMSMLQDLHQEFIIKQGCQ